MGSAGAATSAVACRFVVAPASLCGVESVRLRLCFPVACPPEDWARTWVPRTGIGRSAGDRSHVAMSCMRGPTTRRGILSKTANTILGIQLVVALSAW